MSTGEMRTTIASGTDRHDPRLCPEGIEGEDGGRPPRVIVTSVRFGIGDVWQNFS